GVGSTRSFGIIFAYGLSGKRHLTLWRRCANVPIMLVSCLFEQSYLVMRTVIAGAVAALALALPPASAETLTLGLYGGSFEKAMREVVMPAFQKQHNVEARYLAGNSTDTLARLHAQKAKQEMDVVFLDDGVMFQALALGFCAPLADGPVYRELY